MFGQQFRIPGATPPTVPLERRPTFDASPALTARETDPQRLFAALGDVCGPQPPNDAPDAEWEAWMLAEEFEGMLVGIMSRPAEPSDLQYVQQLRSMLAEPALRDRLGDKAATAERLVHVLAGRI